MPQNTKSLGVAFKDPELEGALLTGCTYSGGTSTGGTSTSETFTTPTITAPAITNLTEVVTATNVILASETGTTFFLHSAASFVSTLPAPAAGLNFKFIVKTAPTSNVGYTIKTAGDTNIIFGVDLVGATGGGTAIVGADIITFVLNSSVIGDRAEFNCDGTNWYIVTAATLNASITAAAT